MDEGISFSLADAIVKTTNRNRGRMKIQIKLSKEQAEGFAQFKKLIKPEDMSEEAFITQVFFAGCNALAEELRAHGRKIQEEALAAELKAKTDNPATETTDE
mgnify:CR=1 FL=1